MRNLATTHLLDRLAAHFGEESREVKVGFKHVTAAWRRSARCSAASPRAASRSVAGSSARTASSRAPWSWRCSPARARRSPSCAR
ncbi:hypothetical protein NKG05_09320 [Oerskovia sp. M15]